MVDLSICSAPLPEIRSRVWILGSGKKSFPASAWKSVVMSLEANAKEMLPHHFLHLEACRSPNQRAPKAAKASGRAQADWEVDAEYHMAFRKALKQAFEQGRLGKDKPTPKPIQERASAKAKCRLTPRQMAAVDVYEQILEIEKGKYETKASAQLADISQTSSRGQIILHGICGTQTTSMR